MQSELLLGAIGVLILAPGVAAALLAYRPGEVGVVTRCAAVFGLGFAVAGGCAFMLAVTHTFYLASYLPLWILATAALWLVVLRKRVPLREHARAVAAEVADNRVALLLGAAVMVAILVVRLFYLHSLPGAHYVYYLNGLEIANDHGIPGTVLEYGQGWPPATDKVFLDSFTGVLPLFDNNSLVGPGVLLWISYAGAAFGLWACSWELGLRRVAILLPVVMLANNRIPGLLTTRGFSYYRAEDFGIAIAFCALALGISAIRSGGRTRAVVAGIVLAVASGTHLVPVVIVVLILGSVILAELVRRGRTRPRAATALIGCVIAGTGGVLGLVIRLLAGGSFGLGGASNQASYGVIHTPFDPTAFMYSGSFLPVHLPETDHFYIPPSVLLEDVMQQATAVKLGVAAAMLILVLALVVAVGFALVRTELGTVGFAGAGVLVGVIAIALYFSYSYHVWVDATFGKRRPTMYVSLGLILPVLGLIEAALLTAAKRGWRLRNWRVATALGVVVVLAGCVWLVPTATRTAGNWRISTGQQEFATWVQTKTPCGARFLLDQRSEGAVAALTGRYALDEGMGAYLRPYRLSHEIQVLLAARRFYTNPRANEGLLRAYQINYVVLAKPWILGDLGPVRLGSAAVMARVPFLRLVMHTKLLRIYHVVGSTVAPVSPLLKGPYLGCRTGPANF